MKKTIFATSLIICLLSSGFAKAQTPFITPASAYTLSANAGTFTDIADNPKTVKCGADLAANTALKNGFFVNDATAPFVTHTANKTKTDPGFALGFDFNLCGQKMKYFTICASGGIQFGTEAAIIQVQSGAWVSPTATYHNLVTVTTWANNVQDPALSINGQAPVMYLIEGEAGQKVLTVQYHYTVNGDEWTYQLKAHEASGNIEFVAGDLNAQNVAYRLFFGLVENGDMRIDNDPFKTMNLHQSDQPAHKIGFNQPETGSAWNTAAIYTPYTAPSFLSGIGLNMTASDKPQSGYTLIFNTPADCAEKPKKFEDAWYSLNTTSVT
ncbi:MAG: hypothetical protein K2G46_05075, partial [Bacteroidales bacterium]|nr:hypothetical protein [Bacteroidales bacterium]